MKDMNRRTFLGRGLGAAGLIGLAAWPARGRADDGADPDAMIAKAVTFLRSRQADDGSWSGDRKVPGITGLVVTALLRSGRVTPDDPAVTKGLAYLEQFVGPKGGVSEARQGVYTTSVALMAFDEANKDGRYDGLIKGAQGYLKSAQWDEDEGKDPEDPYYGGLGYGGGDSRPDLSNTSFMIEALRDSGLPADDPALQKALVFVSRCQNLESEFNDRPSAAKINDGGFLYAPAEAESDAAKKKGGGGEVRSYAGMTYAGLKSMIYAGLTQDDPRVKAAYGYITKNYTLDENPGQGQRGLYYYYQTFAKALSLVGKPTVVDDMGREHDWRADLTAALAKRQEPDGGWVNRDDRFMEGDPNIVTAFGLLALAYARKPA